MTTPPDPLRADPEPLVRLAYAVRDARELLIEYAQREMEEPEVVALLHPVITRIAQAFLEAHDRAGRRLS